MTTISPKALATLEQLAEIHEFAKGMAAVGSIEQATKEAHAAHAHQSQIVEEAKRNAVMFVNHAKVQADIQAAAIEADTAALKARYDELNEHYQAQVAAKAQLDSDVATAEAKLKAATDKLAQLAASLA
ncbi:hypothetical protein [Limnohabitans sp. Bal53]|uniref:hypothetical protein n=1 Tax=Limnohabitans sp. Bal53 TaxID=1977910 RepID=UPI000D3D02D9|nr:hypothetical protein [Limnohabitans sp. Bal53]PUE41427.1 hypothetical protein B9Z50_06885 [Limnohabitans sp. Bal53]